MSDNVIRYHDHEKAARCWATEAKYRRLIASGLIPESHDDDTAPSELSYGHQDGDPA